MTVSQLAAQLFFLAKDGHGDDELRLELQVVEGSCLYGSELTEAYRDTDGEKNIVVIRNRGKKVE